MSFLTRIIAVSVISNPPSSKEKPVPVCLLSGGDSVPYAQYDQEQRQEYPGKADAGQGNAGNGDECQCECGAQREDRSFVAWRHLTTRHRTNGELLDLAPNPFEDVHSEVNTRSKQICFVSSSRIGVRWSIQTAYLYSIR